MQLDRTLKHFCQCSQLTRRHFKDDSPTSWPLLGLHTSAIKGKKCAFFASDIISAIFLYLLKVWSTWIVHWLYLPLPCSCNFLFPVAVFMLEVGPWSVLCAERPLYTLKRHTTHTLSALSAIWAPLYPAKGFKRLLCCSSLHDFRCQRVYSSRKWPVLIFVLAHSPPSPTV